MQIKNLKKKIASFTSKAFANALVLVLLAPFVIKLYESAEHLINAPKAFISILKIFVGAMVR